MKRCFISYLFCATAIGFVGAFAPFARNFNTHLTSELHAGSALEEDNSIEKYSLDLTPRQERDQINEELGFKVDSKLKKVIKRPLKIIGNVAKRTIERKKPPGNLILVRGGESDFSKNFTFTGWLDSALTPAGLLQVCFL
jgi:hypothetical protein